jgi:cysteine desulfurase/selenocysteine lyase
MNRNRFIKSVGMVSGGLFLGKTAGAFASPADFRADLARAADQDDYWSKVRSLFIFPDDYIYMNTGGIGAIPEPVMAMSDKKMRELEMYPRPGHDEAHWLEVKKQVAAFAGPSVDASEIALTSTATEGINIILNGLDLKAGDEVITTTHEHVAMNVPLLNHMRYSGIRVRSFEPDLKSGLNNVQLINDLITPRTRLIILSHVTCTTGQVLPVKEIGRLARDKGILYALDGAQAAGNMPMDVKAIGADFYAACGHKWMLGPKRTGFLYVSKERQDILRPTTVGAYSDISHDLVKGELKFETTAERYEYGTQNDLLFYGLEASMQFLQAIGLEKLHAHNRELAEKFYKGLKDNPMAEILSPVEEQYRSCLITFKMKNKANQETANFLTGEKRIRVRVVNEAGLGGVRASFHVYNQMWEVERLVNVIM